MVSKPKHTFRPHIVSRLAPCVSLGAKFPQLGRLSMLSTLINNVWFLIGIFFCNIKNCSVSIQRQLAFVYLDFNPFKCFPTLFEISTIGKLKI